MTAITAKALEQRLLSYKRDKMAISIKYGFMKAITAVGGTDDYLMYQNYTFDELIDTCTKNGVTIYFSAPPPACVTGT